MAGVAANPLMVTMLKCFNPELRSSPAPSCAVSDAWRPDVRKLRAKKRRSAEPRQAGGRHVKIHSGRIRAVALRSVYLSIAIRPPVAKHLGGQRQDNIFHMLLPLDHACLGSGNAFPGLSYRTNPFGITAAQCHYSDDKTDPQETKVGSCLAP